MENINIHEILWERALDIESHFLRNIVTSLGKDMIRARETAVMIGSGRRGRDARSWKEP